MRLSSLLLLVLAACGGGTSGPIPLERQTFAPSLDVNLSASTRTKSGAYYRDLIPGTGTVVVTSGATLVVDYTGWLADGTLFGSSQSVGQTYTFVLDVGQAIAGWDEGLVGMLVGGTRQLVIPSALAYGPYKRGNIPADSNLVFQVVLHSATAAVSVEETTFAPSLDVNLAASSKTTNGVYLRDTVAGTGAVVATGQTMTVDYTGWLADGTKFDASQDHNSTFSFALGKGKVIAGWDEGLAGVQVGATRQLVIPTQLAYGAAGQGSIPPYANLVFSVVVHSAKP